MDKKVSIITPCFNGGEFVGRYLDSILRQTYKNIELIFVNDGSNDNTEDIVKAYIEKFNDVGMKLIYIYQENAGQAAAMNQGLKIFSGEYLTWPDSDDILTEDSIEKKVKFLEENHQYGLVRTDAKLVNEDNLDNVIGYFGKNNPNKYKEELFEDFIIENRVWFAPGCYMVRSAAYLEVNQDRRIYEGRGGQNWQMLLPITYKYKCGYIDEPLYIYVVRDNSHSHSNASLNGEIDRTFNHENLLTNTLEFVDMSDEERKKYIKIIKEKYIKKRFNIACKFNNKKLAEKYYKEVKKYNIDTIKDRITYIRIQNNALNSIYNGIRKIRRLVR